MSEPQAMTLEEALRRVNENGWSLTFDYLAGVRVTNDNGDSLAASDCRTWPEAVSEALGYPVVERDDTAELVEALKQWQVWARTWRLTIAHSLPMNAAYALNAAASATDAALAKWRERNDE